MVSLFKKIAGAVVKAVAPVMDPLTVAFAHPIQTIKAITGPTTMKQLEQEHFAQPLGKQITEIVTATVGYGTAIVGGAAVGAAAKAGTLGATAAKVLIPATTKGKIIAAVAAPVVIGAVANQPLKAAEAIAKTPGALANVGGNIANLAANPTLEGAKNLVKENPVIVGGAAAVAAVLGAKALLPAIATTRQTAAIEEQTQAIEAATGSISVTDKSGEMGKVYTPETTAATPKTETVKEGGTTTPRRRKKSVSKAVPQNISQRVNVVVANRAISTGVRQTHKYLNARLLN